EADLDAVLLFKGRGERAHDLVDNQIGVIGDLAFLLGLGNQLRADLGGAHAGRAQCDARGDADGPSERSHELPPLPVSSRSTTSASSASAPSPAGSATNGLMSMLSSASPRSWARRPSATSAAATLASSQAGAPR